VTVPATAPTAPGCTRQPALAPEHASAPRPLLSTPRQARRLPSPQVGAMVTKRGLLGALDVWGYPNIHGDVMAVANSSGVKQGDTMSYDPFGQASNCRRRSSSGPRSSSSKRSESALVASARATLRSTSKVGWELCAGTQRGMLAVADRRTQRGSLMVGSHRPQLSREGGE